MLTIQLPAQLTYGDFAPNHWGTTLSETERQDFRDLSSAVKSIAELDATSQPPAEKIAALEDIRKKALPLATAFSLRFSRKPLPLGALEAHLFSLCCAFFHALGVSYLRLPPQIPKEPASVTNTPPAGTASGANDSRQLRVLAYQRAATSWRQYQWQFLLASRVPPAAATAMLLFCAQEAQNMGALRELVKDRSVHQAPSSVQGQVAWALFILATQPLEKSLAQITVLHRAFSRWRELAKFTNDNKGDGRYQDLRALFPPEHVNNNLRWLENRAVLRKIRKRLDALQAGETPTNLKLGYELSSPACQQLLMEMNAALRLPVRQPQTTTAPNDAHPLSITFGILNAYALLTNKAFVAQDPPKQERVDVQKLAIFGFDPGQRDTAPQAAPHPPCELWQGQGTQVWRLERNDNDKHLAPYLIASRDPEARLGILYGLNELSDGALNAKVRWYLLGQIEIGSATVEHLRHPAFLLPHEGKPSLILPPALPVRLGIPIFVNGMSIPRVTPIQVIERGSDFMHYALRLN